MLKRESPVFKVSPIKKATLTSPNPIPFPKVIKKKKRKKKEANKAEKIGSNFELKEKK